jgi:outer membrane protein assembly factor BamB
MASVVMTDPADGREKLLLSSFVSGGTGRLILIDTGSGAGESLTLPGDEGAWALLPLDGKLLVGTCSRSGYLHCLDLATRSWAPPLRDENETYIWNLALGSDGMAYGGTWPGCVLLRYDPGRHVLENMGKMSQQPGNQYSRKVFTGVPGRVFLNCGYPQYLAVWSMETGKVSFFGREGAEILEANEDFVCAKTGDELDFYHPITLRPLAGPLGPADLDSYPQNPETPISRFIAETAHPARDDRLPPGIRPLRLAGGCVAGVSGQDYFILSKDDPAVEFKPIPVEAPPTQILTVMTGPDGTVWGSSALGQTIFRYDPSRGEYWNTPAVCSGGGEVYGMRIIGGKVFMSAYAGGDHIVYDPEAPWDQRNNVNPVTLRSLRPELIRPHARSVVGPDGAFWTGWMARYGVYGGGLSRVDPVTLEVASWNDPVPGQGLEALAAGPRYLYFTTTGNGNGLPARTVSLYLCQWDPAEGKVARSVMFPEGVSLGPLETAGGYVTVGVDEELRVYDCDTLEALRAIRMPAPCSCLIRLDGGELAAFCGLEVFRVRPDTGGAERMASLPGPVRTAAVGRNGVIYFATSEHLYRLD